MTLLLSLLASLTLLVTSTAHAYMTPDDVFGAGTNSIPEGAPLPPVTEEQPNNPTSTMSRSSARVLYREGEIANPEEEMINAAASLAPHSSVRSGVGSASSASLINQSGSLSSIGSGALLSSQSASSAETQIESSGSFFSIGKLIFGFLAGGIAAGVIWGVGYLKDKQS